MAYRWSEAQNRLLIQLVRERPCLWHRSDPGRSNKQIKDSNWEEIDQMLGITGANRRFKSLRDDYTRWTKGTRKEYNYADDMDFLRDEIGHRNGAITRRKDQRLSDGGHGGGGSAATIELSDESQGLYEENQSHSSNLMAAHSLARYFQAQQPSGDDFHLDHQPAETSSGSHQNMGLGTGNSRKRRKSEAPELVATGGGAGAAPNADVVYWQSPVDDTNLSREDFQYCKTIMGLMSPLPVSMRRQLKANIYQLITEAVNKYEESAN